MKKTIVALALVLLTGSAGYQLASAQPGPGYGPGSSNCVGAGPCANLDEAALQARDAFHQATAELRKQISVKQAQLQAAINGGDEGRVAALSGELFELRDQMRNQAQEAGIRQGGFGGCGGAKGAGGRGPGGRGPGARGAGLGLNS